MPGFVQASSQRSCVRSIYVCAISLARDSVSHYLLLAPYLSFEPQTSAAAPAREYRAPNHNPLLEQVVTQQRLYWAKAKLASESNDPRCILFRSCCV